MVFPIKNWYQCVDLCDLFSMQFGDGEKLKLFGIKVNFSEKNPDFKLVKLTAFLILKVRTIGRRDSMPKVYQLAIQLTN